MSLLNREPPRFQKNQKKTNFKILRKNPHPKS